MVGLVVVSHSASLAAGVIELARAMATEAPLAAAGGFDGGLGTSYDLIHAAINQVYSPDGVVVLVDLGSAMMTTENVLDDLPAEQRAHVQLCDAPLVEGAVAAATLCNAGLPIERIIAEARGALAAKQGHLAPPADPAAAEFEFDVPNALGLHARPASKLVQALLVYNAEVHLTNITANRGPVSAKSINAVTTLGARQRHRVRVTAAGPEARSVIQAVQRLIEENFGDTETEAATPPPPTAGVTIRPGVWRGVAASPGIAVGVARLLQRQTLNLPTHPATDPGQEWADLQTALEQVRIRIRAIAKDTARRADRAAAEIFDAHLLFLQDAEWLNAAQQAIIDQKLNAAQAWNQAAERIARQYRALEEPYLQARAADIEGVSRQVLEELLGATTGPLHVEPGILLAPDLSPADTVGLDPSITTGIATSLGGPTSHSAILARSLGIPAVVGLGDALLAITDGTPLILDGNAGTLLPNPDCATEAEYREQQARAQAAAAAARAVSTQPAVMRDGGRIEIAANIGSAKEAAAAVPLGAEGVGLFRTEFLFLDRQTAPSEEEQFLAYRTAAAALGPERPLVIRTLDVGGDKPLPYVDMGNEANPFLGWRAIRICLAQPDFFKVQLRAILRTAQEFPRLRVMFPMVATLAELRAAKSLLAEAAAEVNATAPLEVGIMVEIPAAAVQARQFAPEVDFFSIGTNDLTQYTMAAERGNARVAALTDALEPAVLKLIQVTVEAAQAHGKWVGVCGELAGVPEAIPLLVGLGVTELSMAAPLIPQAKQIIRGLELNTARALAQTALALENPTAIRSFLMESHA